MTQEIPPVPDYPSEFDPTVSTEEIIAAINKHAENSKKQLIKLFGEEYLNKKTIPTK